MSKIDTSPEAIRELVNREVSRSHDDYYSQVCKLHDALKMLLAIADEKEADLLRTNTCAHSAGKMTRNEWIKAVLAMRPPVGFEDRRKELHRRIVAAKTAPFLEIHRKSTHKVSL